MIIIPPPNAKTQRNRPCRNAISFSDSGVIPDKSLMDRASQMPPDLAAAAAQQRRRRERLSWEAQWNRPDYAPPWLGRAVSKEIVEAVEEGWFLPGTAALDIGCGSDSDRALGG